MLVVLAVAGLAAGAAGALGAREPRAQQMVLRLHELPGGFRVGDDSGCVEPGDTEGAEPAVAAWIERYRPEDCSFEYERLYAVPGPGAVPPLVESTAFEVGSEAGARQGLALAEELMRERTGHHTTPTEVPAPAIGAESRLFHSGDIGVMGRTRGKASLLWWRDGEVLATLLVAGGAPAVNDRVAARLAALQQVHIESPSPYTEAERDETLVPLENPHLKLPVYWLGARFAPGRGLPASDLESAGVYLRAGEGPPGERLELDYSRGPRLGTWTRAGWRKLRSTRFTRINWTRSCSMPTRTRLDGGAALVVGVHLRRRDPSEFGTVPKPPRPCPGARPNHYFALVNRGKVVIGVDLAICYTCAEPREGPYDSLRGMEAIVGGLRRR